MMKRKMALLCALCFVMGGNHITYASESSNKIQENNTAVYCKEYLIQKGYPSIILDSYSEKELNQFVTSFQNGDTENTLTWDIIETDNLEEIQEFVNATDEQLKSYGLSESEIFSAREEVMELNSKSDNYLTEQYNLTNVELKYLRKALTKNQQYYRKKINKKAQLSGTISSTKLTFSISKTTNSSSKPDYTIQVKYNWLKPFFLESMDDKIAVAWGGGLNVKSISSNNDYYKIKGLAPSFSFNGFKTSKKWSYTESPQKGIIFQCKQSTGGVTTTRMKSGYVKFKLYQTKYKGYETNCVAQYGHKTIGFGSVNISKTPTVSITGSYDKTNSKKVTLKY